MISPCAGSPLPEEEGRGEGGSFTEASLTLTLSRRGLMAGAAGWILLVQVPPLPEGIEIEEYFPGSLDKELFVT
ncbi:hypothetical protein GMSM_22910 [Geomonas sp. Red276]